MLDPDTIFNTLDKLGFGIQNHAIRIQFSDIELNAQVMLQRIHGQHRINSGLSAELICLSKNPFLSLKQFIGCRVAVDQVTDQNELIRTTGIVTGASQGKSDGGMAVYRLTLQDATSLWHKRRNSRVFVSKSVPEIIQILFKEWQSKSTLFASSLLLDISGLTKTYDIRPFVMQYNETDYDFITRILREEAICWLVDESNPFGIASRQIEAQQLKLIDENNQFQSLKRRNIRYHNRSQATEKFDCITSFTSQRELQPTSTYIQRWQADELLQEDGSGSVLSSHVHSQQLDNVSLSLEQAWSISPAWVSDLKGEDQATSSTHKQIEKTNQHFSQLHELQSKYFTAHSSVRDAQVGYWFKLENHPELNWQHTEHDKEFLILNKTFYNQNNLPTDIQDQLDHLLKLSHWHITKDRQEERQFSELTVIRRHIPVVPEYNPLVHRPTAHIQRAIVVGTDNEEIYVDEWGRIKVRFLFTRPEDHAHDGGAGSNNTDTDSAWVDVLTPWAGEGHGVRFLPRKGEIVAIDFFEGNIDRPFVIGRLHEAHRSPTQFDTIGKLPDTKKLSGIRSKEVLGQGFNQLRFDDTTGQISAQIQSSHSSSQLNLGHLSHPKENSESESRGDGFELRTDAWGAIRASKGMLLTTEGDQQALGAQLSRGKTKTNIEFHTKFDEYFKDLAKAHDIDEPDLETQTQLNEKLNQYDKNTEGLMALHSDSGILIDSQQGTFVSSKKNIDMSTPENLQFFTGKNWIAKALNKISIFAKHAGIKIKSGEGDIDISSQKSNMNLSSRKKMHIYALEDLLRIESGKGILINAQDAYIKIEGGNIEIGCPGTLELKGGQVKVTHGSTLSSQLPKMPEHKASYDEHFILHYPDGTPAKNIKYRMTSEDGQVHEGISDESGKTNIYTKDAMAAIHLEIL